jgi:hypothetical protein
LGTNPLLIDVQQRQRIIQFLAFAQYLCLGGSYYFRRVQSATIERYLLHSATLVSSVTGYDPRKEKPTDRGLAPPIAALLTDYKRWEKVPNRKEPWTPELQRNLDDFVQAQTPEEFSLLQVLSDFTATGLYTGCRVSEYAQTSGVMRRMGKHALDRVDNSSVAFTLHDIKFFKGKRPITHHVLASCASINVALEMVDSVTVTWTTQKNQIRGESKSYHKNQKCPGLCPVYRFLRIILRFIKLMGHTTDIPVSIYRDNTGAMHNIVRTDVDSVLQSTVQRLFKLDPVTDKETYTKWTSHSIRVGACNILFGAGLKDTVIQFRLRWRSLSFMNYFRNLGAISQAQNDAVNMAIDHPDLFY